MCNKGVQSINHSTINQSLNSQSINVQTFKDELPKVLDRVSRQEFITFMTIFQQEDELGQVTYDSLAQALKITAGCVRTYVSGLIKKGFPVVKAKYNNKLIILKIPEEFKNLTLKKRLMNTFYNLDPSQKSITDDF